MADQLQLPGARLVRESTDQYSDKRLFCDEAACDSGFRRPSRHDVGQAESIGGSMGQDVLLRIKEHVVSRLREPIKVADLARIAGRSPFHFSRVFLRSVGVTPHRYVIHLRLRCAVELLRRRELSLAQIAARTGFADQSHLSRWIRRVYGVPIRQLLQDARSDKHLPPQSSNREPRTVAPRVRDGSSSVAST